MEVFVFCLIVISIGSIIFYFLKKNWSNKKVIVFAFLVSAFLLILTLWLTIPNLKYPQKSLLDSPIDELVKGKIAFHIPDTMEIEKSYRAIGSITKAMNDSILCQGIDVKLDIQNIKVSSKVMLLLIDPTNQNFKINALNTDEQLVDDSSNTIWRWNVIPIKSGQNELIMRVSVKIKNNDGEYQKDMIVFERPIIVNASIGIRIKQFIYDNWQWLISVCIIPLLIWLYNRFSNRKQKKEKRNQIGFEIKNENKH